MMDLTISKLKKMSVDAAVVDMVAKCLVTEAKSQLTREVVDGYLKPVFESFTFYVSDDMMERRGDKVTKFEGIEPDGRITVERLVYMTDLTGENYLAYEAACREAHLTNDFANVVKEREEANGDAGWCPALIAEDEWLTAKNELANHIAKDWLEMKEINYPHSDKLVKIVIGMVLSGPAGGSLRSKELAQ